jgi:hypothetical protein
MISGHSDFGGSNMARFKIATVDGYEVTVEDQRETPADFAAADHRATSGFDWLRAERYHQPEWRPISRRKRFGPLAH